MHPHHFSQLPQETVQFSPKSLGDLVLIGGPGATTNWRDLLVSDVGISGGNWNGSPFPSSSMQQNGNSFYHFTVDRVDTIADMPRLGRSPEKYHSMLPSSGETSAADGLGHQRPSVAQYSLLDASPGSQTRIKTPANQFAIHPFACRASRNLFLPLDTDTPQSWDWTMKESQAITDAISNSSCHKQSMEEIQKSMMLFNAQLFPDDCSYRPSSSQCSTNAARLQTMPHEANHTSQTHSQGERRASTTAPFSPACGPKDRGAMIEKPYQCGACCIGFSQRQGLTRHSKDKHSPKKRCDFCMEFTWAPGRRYVYQRHLEEKHPQASIVSRVRTAPIVRRRGVTGKLKGQRFRQNCIAPCTS